MDYVPASLPKAVKDRLIDWSDERDSDEIIMVTLAKGFAFYDNDVDDAACHVRGFPTRREAVAEIRQVERCTCRRCLCPDEPRRDTL